MINKSNKNELRKKRSLRVRKNIHGTEARPRLSVYRSLNHIYAQIIDDVNGKTLVSASTVEKDFTEYGGNKDAAFEVGKAVGAAALKLGIKKVVFDRSGYIYTGRVQKLADGARSAGLEFQEEIMSEELETKVENAEVVENTYLVFTKDAIKKIEEAYAE